MDAIAQGRCPLVLSDVHLSKSETDALFNALVFYEDEYFASSDISTEHLAVLSLLKTFFGYVK